MIDGERMAERHAITAWLRNDPFPWMRRPATLRERIMSAWLILRHGEVMIFGLCELLAAKIEEGDHQGSKA